jgi:N-methylhydantoinase A
MRVGFDIGGTFTDVVLLTDDGRLTPLKLLSLTDRIGESIGAFIDSLARAERIDQFIHATTTASNAVIERKTALTGLLCTSGFRDDLEMRGQRRPNIYDVNWERLPALIQRRLRLEVNERITGAGEIARPLDSAAAERAVHHLIERGVEAIAVCLINAYLNPTHERELRNLIARISPATVCCLSSDIDPEIGEYERASTTVINASLIPVFERYMTRLESRLEVYSDQFFIMQSNGGILSARSARLKPANLIESGPAAGVLAAARLAQQLKLDKVLSFDMGGTTAKACLIERGIPFEKASGEVGGGMTSASRLFGNGGHILRVPWLDIVEVGAGGGSICWVEKGTVLKVGPESAGAEPGPVCYGRGGQRPTLTDANVVLGYINPTAIADATVAINRDAAWTAIKDTLATPLGLGVPETAYGATRVANAAMMRALRAVSTERGRDPREFTLIAFGGGGPLHAVALAETLGIRRVCVPIYPGLFSALGLLLADYSREYVRGISRHLNDVRPVELLKLFESMEQQALEELKAEGNAANAIIFKRQVAVKHNFQLSPTTVSIPDDLQAEDFKHHVAVLFARSHEINYGYANASSDTIDLVSLRLRATKPATDLSFEELGRRLVANRGTRAPTPSRLAYFGTDHGWMPTPICSRWHIQGRQPGPLVIDEPDCAVIVPPGWLVSKDRSENLFIDLSQ